MLTAQAGVFLSSTAHAYSAELKEEVPDDQNAAMAR